MNPYKLIIITFIMLVLGFMTSCQAPVPTEEIKKTVAGLNEQDYKNRLAAMITVEKLVRDPKANKAQRTCIEDELMKIVTTKVPLDARQFACQMLWIIGTNRSMPALVEALSSEESHLVEAACYALSRYTQSEVGKVLRDALTQTQGAAQVAVINTLGNRRDAESLDQLVPLARDEDASAEAAIAAIGKIAFKDIEAATVLAKLRETGSAKQRLTASHAYLQSAQELARAGNKNEAQAIFRELSSPGEPDLIRRGAIVGRIEVGGEDEDIAVLSELEADEGELRATAIATIASMNRPGFAKTFAGMLPSLSEEDQVLLIQALSTQNKPEVRKAFVKAIDHVDERVRLAALRGLGQVGDKSTVSLLVKKLDEAGSRESDAIAISLITLSGEEVDVALVEAMQSSSNETRVALISVLGERRSKIAIPVLFEEAVSQDINAAEEAYKALRDLVSPTDLPKLLELLDNLENEQLRSYAERAATRSARRAKDPAESTAILIAKLQNVDHIKTRQSILRVLGVVGGTDAFAALTNALKDDDASIKDTAIRAAVQAVVDWPNDEAEQVLLNIYTTTNVPAHRRLALQGYVRVLGQKDENEAEAVVDKYIKLANYIEGSDEKKLLLSGLAKVKHPEALFLTRNYLEDRDVHAEAAVAILTVARKTNVLENSWAVKIMEKLLEVSNDEDIRNQVREILQSAPED